MTVQDETQGAIHRVWFEGAELDKQALAALSQAGAVWEGEEGSLAASDDDWLHSARLRAHSAREAKELIAVVLDQFGAYRLKSVELVVGAGGEPWRGPIDRSWEEVDWSVSELAAFSALERTVIWALLDDHEPTWIILRAFDVEPPRADAEQALRRLETLGLVDHRLALSMEPADDGDEPVPWWALTDRAWDLLELIKSPRYRR